MGRPKKEGAYFSFKMSTDLSKKLQKYCENTGANKTGAIEVALKKFLLEYEEKTERDA